MRASNKNTLIDACYQIDTRYQLGNRLKTTVAALSSLLMVACEAPLNLDSVDAEKTKKIRRSDQFMAVRSSQDRITIVGSDGIVLNSAKSPLNWQRQELPGNPNLVDIERCPNGDLIALGMEHQLWLSKDQGQQWTVKPLATEESMIAVSCAPNNSYWVSGSFSTILSSQDEGEHWQAVSLDEDASITQLQFFDNNNAVAVGEFGLLAKSTDAGASWQMFDPIPNDFFPLGAYFETPLQGWVAGLGGIIYTTVDGGLSWQQQNTSTESPLYGFRQYRDRLFAFGDHGTALELQQDHWQKIPGPKIPIFFRDGDLLSDTQLLVAGGWGTVFTLDLSATVKTSNNKNQ